jgi:hypothetical protein
LVVKQGLGHVSEKERAQSLHGVGIEIDAIQIVPVSIGFGLQIAALDTLDEAAQSYPLTNQLTVGTRRVGIILETLV